MLAIRRVDKFVVHNVHQLLTVLLEYLSSVLLMPLRCHYNNIMHIPL